MSILKGIHNMLEAHYKRKQAAEFLEDVRFAKENNWEYFYFDEDKIDLILVNLYRVGYKIEKVENNQFRVSGWFVWPF